MSIHTPIWKSLLVFVFVLAFIQPCYAKKALHVPVLLQPWVDWVLHDKEEQLACIPQYNDANIYQCNWPSELEVALNDQGGEFSQSWLVTPRKLGGTAGKQQPVAPRCSS